MEEQYAKLNQKKRRRKELLTVGGNVLDFKGNVRAPTASFTTAKQAFNSVVSTPGARCLLAEIKHFYFNNILPDPKFMRILLKIIP